ncbi:MAG: diguanylate cyclase [Elusimicrobia bacterium]|nr:diguanylate cyclase [Elusimicrobiota bacterium]
MISSADILKAKILIVDDRQTNIQLLERMLDGAGYAAVTSTTEPEQVCALQRANGYDLILLDLEMPGMDGFQVMDKLKELDPGGYLPVLAVTANPAHKLRALYGGARDFISKPFDLSEVLMRVRNMLEVRLLHAADLNHAKHLEAMALNDALTGLANRRLLADRLGMALIHARRNKNIMAVLYLDLDGFKAINDTLGHAAGDELLRLVARRLELTVREEDTVARLGGDEFGIALWNVGGVDDASSVAAKVIAAVSRPYTLEGRPVTITVSAGVALCPAHGDDADTLLKSADAALYEAKHAGKNGFRIAADAPVKESGRPA